MARRVLAAALASTVAVWAVLLVRIVFDPVNHVGIDPLLAVVPFPTLAVVSWLTRTPTRASLRIALTAYALLSILAIVALDRANVLVEYDRWAERGMPDRPCAGIASLLWACAP